MGGLVLIYLAYMQVSDTPEINVEEVTPSGQEDNPLAGIDDQAGPLEDTGMAVVKKTRFEHRNEDGQIDRVFGFEVLTYAQGGQGVVTNPYMKLIYDDFNCNITADKGEAQVDMGIGEPMPDDVTFSGNVVVRIIASDPDGPEEVFIYLDDVAFIGDESLFSTTGSVRLVSSIAQLNGRGLELVYDELLGQLLQFRIKDLQSLRIRSDQFTSLTSQMETASGPPETEPAVSEPEETGATVEPPAPETVPEASGEVCYQCIFYRNVTIATPKEMVTARDRFSINNILWSDSKPESQEKPATPKDRPVRPAAEPNETERLPIPGPDALNTTASKSVDLDAIPESFFDIVVTCDAGFVIAPADRLQAMADPCDANASPLADEAQPPQSHQTGPNDPNRRTVVAQAQRVDVDVSTSNTTLTGPIAISLVLDPNEMTGEGTDGRSMPMNISVQESAQYVAASNEILLEGPCLVTLEETDPNYQYEYSLSAPRLMLGLMEDPNAQPDDMAISLRQFVASGGTVSVNARRKIAEEWVGEVELLASKLDYQADKGAFAVSGPGRIALRNEERLDAGGDPNDMLNQPCFAFLRNFDSLLYSASMNQMAIDANSGQIQVDYFPLVDGAYDSRPIYADVGRIEIEFAQIPDNRTELLSLKALQGIVLKDEATYECSGSTLFYDHRTSLITVTGDESQACSFNGALVDKVEIDAVTGDVKTHIRGPSILQINPQ